MTRPARFIWAWDWHYSGWRTMDNLGVKFLSLGHVGMQLDLNPGHTGGSPSLYPLIYSHPLKYIL